jgi:hypothetical protein
MALLATNGLVGCGKPASPVTPEIAKANAPNASMPTNVTQNAPQPQPAPQAQVPVATLPAQPMDPSVVLTKTEPVAPLPPAPASVTINLSQYALPKEGPIFTVQGGGDAAVPVPVPPPGGATRVAFMSCRFGGGGASDIFIYDFVQDTVLALPAVNTPAAEANPEISANGRFVVYQTDVAGNWDIRMLDMATMLINTLPGLNTPSDETQPDCSDTGMIVFVVNDCISHNFEMLRLYDGATGDTYIVPVRLVTNVTWPSISADGSTIAFGAFPIGFGTQDIYMYRIGEGLGTPPFVNTAFNDYNPELSPDGESLLFVSDRNGSEDIFLLQADGWVNNMVFANSAFTDEQEPRYLDPHTVIYQTTGGGPVTLRLTGIDSGLIDTLPIASAGGILNAQLRTYLPNAFDPFPGSPFIGGGPDDCDGCGIPGIPGFPGVPDFPGYPGPIGGPIGVPGPDYGHGPGPDYGHGGPDYGHGGGSGPIVPPKPGPDYGHGPKPGPDYGQGPKPGPVHGPGPGPKPGPDYGHGGGSGPIVPPRPDHDKPNVPPRGDRPNHEPPKRPDVQVPPQRPDVQVPPQRPDVQIPPQRPDKPVGDRDKDRDKDKDNDKDKGGRGGDQGRDHGQGRDKDKDNDRGGGRGR